MTRVCVLDYGSGNLKSVYNLFASLSASVVISNRSSEIGNASHLVLPGVGAFGSTMFKIQSALSIDVLEQAVLNNGKPFLGICVGMHVMADRGTEFGDHTGLGWIPGTVRRLSGANLPLPHIGWNNVVCERSTPLLTGLEDGPDFYFVHSFAFHAANAGQVVATTEYVERFCSVIQQDNLCGVQFHPEKSQGAGVRLAKNFLALS
jgi:glutamine amidotransferase